MAISFGNVSEPPYERRIISNENGSDPQAGPRTIVGTCVHRMEGNLLGTEEHFSSGVTGLTDYGIDGALDDPSLDGAIYMWNDPRGSIVPYANGPANGLEGDGPAFVNAYPASSAVPDPVNSLLVSIELSGQQTTEVTPAQFESLCQLIAYWHDQARVPWDRFPVNPASGVVTQLQHYEFTGEKECPFQVVKDLTAAYQDRVREIMRQYQEGGTPPPSGNYSKADIVKTNATMNLRAGPGTAASVITTLPVNAILVLAGQSEYRDGAWWFDHHSHWGYGWSTDRFTEYAGAQNFSRNSGGDAALTGIRAIGGATVSYTPSGHVRVACPAGSANAGVQYSSFPNLNIGDGRSVIAIWDQLGLYGNNYDFLARYRDGTTQQVSGPYAGQYPDGATWTRNFSSVLRLNGNKICDELLFRMRNHGTAARVFHVDNVDFISI